MKYVDRVLQPGESLKHLSRLHWIVYLPGSIWILIGLIGLLLPNAGEAKSVLFLVIAVVVALGLAQLIRAWIRRWTTEIAVTDRRIIYKRGLIDRHTIEMNMDKVESVDVHQSVIGRILGYGTIWVRGTGGGIEPLRKIDTPIEFRNCVTAC